MTVGIWGRVTGLEMESGQKQVVRVRLGQDSQTIRAIYYKFDQSACQIGDWVQVNTSALDLDLGTGGYGFVAGHLSCNQAPGEKKHPEGGEPVADGTDNGQCAYATPLLSKDRSTVTYPGHIVKLRYTPQQTPVCAAEAPESEYHHRFRSSFSLQGKTILLGELHSMLPVMASLLQHWRPDRHLVYIMDDQAALHMGFSDHVHHLKKHMNVSTITYGQALGGDVETVNVYTALEAAVKVLQADDILITQGPGVVGTNTPRGFSGMQLAHWIHAVHTCGGRPLPIPRYHTGDARSRHYGLSHHTLEALKYHTLVQCHIPYPVNMQGMQEEESFIRETYDLKSKHELCPVDMAPLEEELQAAFAFYGQPIKTMGRTFTDDPYFFYAIASAFAYYRSRLL